MIFRSEEAKRDPVRSWHRPDRPFFATGACHILAGIFLKTYPFSGFRAFFIQPHSGFRGSHVFVSDQQQVFDYHGYSQHEVFIAHYFSKCQRLMPGWQCNLIPLAESPLSESFCHTHHHRLPHQYLHDPLPRALTYLRRFPPCPEASLRKETDPSTTSG